MGREDDSRARPALGGAAVGHELDGIAAAYRRVQVAHHGVTLGLLEDRRRQLEGEHAAVKTAIAEIDGVIAFWTGMTSVVETQGAHAASLASGRTARDAKDAMGQTAADRAADATDRALDNDVPHYAPGHEPKPGDADFQPPQDAWALKDVEDYYDTWAPGGDKAAHASPTGGAAASIPEISIPGVVEVGLRLMNKERIDALENEMEKAETKLKTNSNSIQWETAKKRIAAMRAAQTELDTGMARVGDHGLGRRQLDVVQLGSELDRYAREHRADLDTAGAGELAPAAGTELHTTTMAVAAKVMQFRAVSALATGAFDYPDLIATIQQLQAERSGGAVPTEARGHVEANTAYQRPPALPMMTDSERDLYQVIAGTYLTTLQTDEQWAVRLAGVQLLLDALTRKLAGVGADAGGVPPARF